MRSFHWMGLTAALALTACGPAAFDDTAIDSLDVDAMGLSAGSRITDHYIVTVRDGIDAAAVAAQHGVGMSFRYNQVLNGFAGFIPPGQLARIENDPDVLRVEPDEVVTAFAQTVPWGIKQIGSTTNSTKAGDGTGTTSGPTVFVIDTGIDQNHLDLYVVGHVNYAGGPNKDCNGHGTHVAGTVGARDNGSDVVGVAPGVALFGVKVLSCSGSGSWSGVIKGMDFVTGHSAKRKVANLSLGGGYNQSINDAAARMVNADVAVAVAAGNDGKDAKNYSPASEPSVLTVAAYDSTGTEPSWSNFGAIVDLAAPGVSVLSTKNGGGTTTMSGTSMASPHVAGALALYRANNSTASGKTAMSAVVNNTSGTTKKYGFGMLYVGNW